MPGFSNLSLPRWPEEDAPLTLPSGFHPDGLLGGLNLGAPGASIDAWANGTHILSPLSATVHSAPDHDGASERAEGISKAMEGTKLAAEGAHGFGAMTALAAGARRAAPAIEGLEMVNKGFVYPLTIGKGVADTFGDVHNGASLQDAILGNAVRSGLVLGATALGQAIIPVPIVGGAIGGYAADLLLPRGSSMGHGIIQGMADHPPQPLDYL